MNKPPLSRAYHALLAASLTLPAMAQATPTAGSPYYTDVADEYVQDATSDGMANVNMVLCIMNAMSPSDMLTSKGVLNTSTGTTEVKYIALVDKSRCDSQSRSSASNSTGADTGATSTPNYMNAVVDITRGSNASDPMVGKIWMSLAQTGGTVNVSVRMTSTTSPTVLPPYGQLHLDYVGYIGSQLQFNGFIDTNGGTVNHVETGQNSSNVSLTLNAVDTNTGNGVIQAGLSPTTVNYTFAYNSSAFARRTGSGSDQCFDRTKANASRSVWRYGIYDATSGQRVDQTNPGFPLTAVTGTGLTGVASGQTLFGYASYWGVNFGGIDPSLLPNLADGQITALSSISDGRTGNSTNYNLYKNSGKLTLWTKNNTTLAAISGVPFYFFGEGCKLVNGGNGVGANSPSGAACTASGGNLATPDFRNWVMQWNSTLQLTRNGTPITGNFEVIGTQDCSSGNCLITTYNSPTTAKQGFKQMAINAWSDALGNITIPLPAGDTMTTTGANFHSDSDPVYYYSQSTVLPSSANPLTLYCLSNCPTASSLAAAHANGNTSPFASPTDQQWGTGTSEVTYTFGANGLLDNTSTPVIAQSISNAMSQDGVNSGRLFATDLSANCPTSYCEPPVANTYYTYQTGGNQWNQTMWLTANGNTINFDAPVNVPYTVPTGSAYGSWAGKSIQLQFNGFGNLNGIPGYCVDPQSNLVVSCTSNSRFVPAFALPDNTPLTIAGEAVLTRALETELRLASETCPGGLSTSGVTAVLPTTVPQNPTLLTDPTYIGTAPQVTGAPSVIDGVLQ